jgi:aldehyde:ferredoxin oxidoreductase
MSQRVSSVFARSVARENQESPEAHGSNEANGLCLRCKNIRRMVEAAPRRKGEKTIRAHNNITCSFSTLEESSRKGCVGCALLCQGWSLVKERLQNVDASDDVHILAHYRSLSMSGYSLMFYNLEGGITSSAHDSD